MTEQMMTIEEVLESYLVSPLHGEAEIRRGFNPNAGLDDFVRGMEARLERHRQQIVRQYLARLGDAIILPAVMAAVALLNATSVANQAARDTIYQNVFDLVAECGREGLTPLLDAIAHPDPEVRALGAVLLGCHEEPTPAMVTAIATLLADDDRLVRWAAATALVLWGDDTDRATWAVACSALTDFAARAMLLLPEVAAAHARSASETSRDYADAILVLRVLPALLGARAQG